MTSLTYSAARGSAARSQRTVIFAAIAGLHAAVIALIVSGFGRVVMQMAIDPLIGIDIPIEHPVDPPAAPPPPPTLRRVEVDPGPPPVIPIEIEGAGSNAITAPFVPPQPPLAVAQPVTPPVRVIGKHRLPNTDDYYPASDIRGNVQGTSTVGVCVDASGKRTGDPTVVQSSGSASLDQGAMHVLRDGRYARAMQGDQYVPNCYQFRIVFKLK